MRTLFCSLIVVLLCLAQSQQLFANGLVGQSLNIVEPDNATESTNDFGSIEASGAIGSYNYLSGSVNSLLIGNANEFDNVTSDLVVGDSNFGFGTLNSFLLGDGNQTSNVYNAAIFGSYNYMEEADTGLVAGQNNYVSGPGNFALGVGLISLDVTSPAKVIVGNYNTPRTNQLFVIGNGTGPATAERHNALEVYQNGAVRLGKRGGDIPMGEFGNSGSGD